MEAQPAPGWFAVGSFAAAAAGLLCVAFSIEAAIALSVLSLAINAYGSSVVETKIGARRIWLGAGAFVSAAIGAALVLVDKVWLAVPIAAGGLAINAFVRARHRARLGRGRGLRIAVWALFSAAVGALVAWIGFEAALAFSLLPIVVAQYRRVQRDPRAPRRNLKFGWIALLNFMTSATIAFTIAMAVLLTQFGDAADEFHEQVEHMKSNPITAPTFTIPGPGE